MNDVLRFIILHLCHHGEKRKKKKKKEKNFEGDASSRNLIKTKFIQKRIKKRRKENVLGHFRIVAPNLMSLLTT